MRRLLLISPVIALIIFLHSCDDIIERSLKKSGVKVLSPPDSALLSGSSVTFWWETVKGATGYNIQIVKPSFSNIQLLVVDSSLTADKCIFDLQPGNYEWRIKAFNNSSETDFFTFTFTVDSTINLSNQIIQLLSPTPNLITNQSTVDFDWADVYYADDYRFEILSNSGAIIHTDGAVGTSDYTYTFQNEGDYTWKVRAQNNVSVSSYFSSGLTIDQTAPAMPTSLSPSDNSFVTNPFTLSWTQTTDSGSGIMDSLYIFSDQNEVNLLSSASLSSLSYSDSLGIGTYYWKLRAIDGAGNSSAYTTLRKFTVQ